MKMNCIAIDDEPLALEKIESYVRKVSFLNLIAKFDNAIASIDFLRKNKVDLMFLDIQMDDFTGIQLLETLTIRPRVILTTAYDHYALKGYELEVDDYLLKPIPFDRFLQAVNKVYNHFSNSQESAPAAVQEDQSVRNDFVFIKTEYRMQKVVFRDIFYIEGMKDYLRIVTSKDKIMTLLNFNRMEELLPSADFIRIHKSFIIAIDKIESIERKHVIINTQRIPIGDTYRQYFFETLKKRKML